MVEFWVNRIRQGRASIDDVPAKWRDCVRARLSGGGIIQCASASKPCGGNPCTLKPMKLNNTRRFVAKRIE